MPLILSEAMSEEHQARKRTFRKFTYRGVDLDQLLDMNHEQLMELFPCRIRRKFTRGLKVSFLWSDLRTSEKDPIFKYQFKMTLLF